MPENKTYKTNNEEIEDLAPFLASSKRENPFQVPENYFEELPGKIQHRVQNIKSDENQGIRRQIRRPLYYIATAAASILILFSIWFFANDDGQTNDLFTEISFETLMEESPELIEYMDENALIDMLFVYSSDGIDFSDVQLDQDTNFTEDDIFEYLNNEEISNEFLYNL